MIQLFSLHIQFETRVCYVQGNESKSKTEIDRARSNGPS